ncbi:hypothetical protein HDU93_001068, partial [Gonapodya sp. JEL0774]
IGALRAMEAGKHGGERSGAGQIEIGKAKGNHQGVPVTGTSGKNNTVVGEKEGPINGAVLYGAGHVGAGAGGARGKN